MKRDVLFWRLASFFVIEREYIVLSMDPSRQSLLLENRANTETPLIYLSRQELGWANELGRSVNRARFVADEYRKQTGRRAASMLNVIVASYAPVDDYAAYLKPVEEKRISVETVLWTNETEEAVLARFEERFSNLPSRDELAGLDPEEAPVFERAVLSFEAQRRKEEKQFFHYGKPLFTYVFTAVNIVLFVLMTMAGGSTNTAVLIEYGAKFNPLILDGEWWRFFTPMFLHIGLLHLVMNSFALHFLGTAVEQIYGRLRFLWIYLFSGFTGSLLSFLMTPNLSAGASGAIFGLFGALLYFGVAKPKLFFRTMGMNVLVVIGINLGFGFSVPGIDNAGHIGGLIGGFLATGAVHFPEKKRPTQQLLFTAALIAAISGGLYAGLWNGQAAVDAQSVTIQAADEIDAGDEAKAEALLTSFLEDGGEPIAETYFYLGYVQLNDNRLQEAKEQFQLAIQLRPSFHEAHYNLALIEAETGNSAEALAAVEKALQYKPGDTLYEELRDNLQNR